jgi:DNA-binding transcriptional LysR family regulator
VLCEVAEAGSLVRAAGNDSVRQSQFSRQIKELEDFFGVELTRRHGKGLVLTENGKELAQIARESIGRLHDFQLRAQNQPVTFSIGSGDSLVQWLILPRLAALQRRLPNINLRLQNLRSVEIANRLQELSLDFGIVRHDALPDSLASFPIGKTVYALFCSKRLKKNAKLTSPREILATMPLIMQTSDGVFMRQFRDWEEKNGLTVSKILECDSFPQACVALKSGDYAAILPTIARCELPQDNYLEVALPFLNKRPRQLCVAWNPRTLRLRNEAAQVCEALKSVL